MPASSVPYLIPFFLSALLSFGLAFYAAHFYRVPGAKAFIVLSLVQSAWTVSMILEIISPTVGEKQFWDSVQWGLIFFCVISGYWFTQSILPAKNKAKVPRWLLFVFPIVFMAVLISDPTLIYPNEGIIKGFPFDSHAFGFSIIDLVALIYVYTLLIFCISSLFIAQRQTSGQIQRQLRWAFIGIFVQAGMYFALFVSGISILGQRDTAPFTFLVGNFILGWGMFRNRFFELGPIARSQVVENMADAFIVTDAQGKIVDMNRVAQVYASREQSNGLISETFDTWVSEINPEKLVTPFTRDIVRNVDDTLRSLELKVEPLADSQKDIAGYLVLVRDISQRKMLENALAASEARYRSIIDSLSEGVILHDQTGVILTCNQSAESILGLSLDQIEGHNIREMVKNIIREDGTLFPPDSLPMNMIPRDSQPVRDLVVGIPNAQGSTRWLLINSGTFKFNDQDMVERQQMVISFRDVTELRRMQEETMRLEIAQDRAQLLAQFIKSASHEFRTPLAILGTSSYLMSRQADPAKRKEHDEIAQAEIKRLDNLLETLVNMVQLDSGVAVVRVPTHIDSLLRSIMVQFEKNAKEHDICLQLRVPIPVPEVKVDPDYLHMGMEQVLDNAIRYTPDGGKIDLELTCEATTLTIKVQDSGLGIAEDELDHIFDRFWRHDAAHSTPGFGLGLSIAQKVMELHNGTIRVESKVGHGTTVIMKLPV